MTDSSFKRRKFKRASLPPEEFFVYFYETNSHAVVMDISMGGFKIECYPYAGSKSDSITVDIYAFPEGRFHMIRVPCRVVYDIANLVEGGTFSGSHSRICGLKYEKLTTEQKDKLEYLLNPTPKPDRGSGLF